MTGNPAPTPGSEDRVKLLGLDRAGFEALAEGLDLQPFHIQEMYRWVYQRRHPAPGDWTNLPKAARAALLIRSTGGLPELAGSQLAADGARKFLLRLHDGQTVECVYIPDGERRTVCVSSQVGCALGCRFCLTGTMGLARNLSAGEILAQFFILERETDLRERPYNVVFMGMGEPLANRGNLEKALEIMTDPNGMSFSKRRITVSTVGLAGALEQLAVHPACPRLAISLHAATDDLRNRLMPVNRRYPLDRIRAVLQSLSRKDRDPVSLEYILLKDVNDSAIHARDLAAFARGLKVKVNLIHFNPAAGLPFERSTDERARAFQRVLLDARIRTSIRRSRGLDILAACGQLARAQWPAEGQAP